MTIEITETEIGNVLTRTGGYLQNVATHSLQPYRGCSFGNSLCGVGCYVQHARHLLAGRTWGQFLEVRVNTAESYLKNVKKERAYAHRLGLPFGIFCSSSTDPFVPQESRFGVTRSLLVAMQADPPDVLILQTHSPGVIKQLPLLLELAPKCRLRVHLSIESDSETLPGLPPPAASVASRLNAAAALKRSGIATVITVSPLLPIENPARFFSQIAEVADAVVLDHFIGGDGTKYGSRTMRTPLPAAMQGVLPRSTEAAYLHEMTAVAMQFLPGRVGIGSDGFAGRYLPVDE